MTKKYDIKNDPKFKAKVAKLEGNQYTRVLKVPLRVSINEIDYFIACVGINDAYMVVRPLFDDEASGFGGFEVFWSKNDGFRQPTQHHEHIQHAFLNWSMLHADESSFIKKKHLDVKIVEAAVECCSKVVSQETMAKAGAVFPHCMIQNVFRDDITNPYHR